MWQNIVSFYHLAKDWFMTQWHAAFMDKDPRAIGWLALFLVVFGFFIGAFIF
jgi:hypothetical protein